MLGKTHAIDTVRRSEVKSAYATNPSFFQFDETMQSYTLIAFLGRTLCRRCCAMRLPAAAVLGALVLGAHGPTVISAFSAQPCKAGLAEQQWTLPGVAPSSSKPTSIKMNTASGGW